MSAIYEQAFLDASYGFREGKSGHNALKTLELSIMKGGVNYLIDVGIKGYFDHVDHKFLRPSVNERTFSLLKLTSIAKRVVSQFGTNLFFENISAHLPIKVEVHPVDAYFLHNRAEAGKVNDFRRQTSSCYGIASCLDTACCDEIPLT